MKQRELDVEMAKVKERQKKFKDEKWKIKDREKIYQEAENSLIKTEDGRGRGLEAMRETIRVTILRVHS